MREIALLQLAKDQMPANPSSFQKILERNGIIGQYTVKEESVIYKDDEITIEFALFYYEESLSINKGYGIDIAAKGDLHSIVETILVLKQIFEEEFEESVFSSEYIEEEFEDYDESDTKTEFDVMLKSVGATKLKVIKEITTLLGIGLKDAKALIDAPPYAVKKGVSKEEAEDLKGSLEAVGAEVELKSNLRFGWEDEIDKEYDILNSRIIELGELLSYRGISLNVSDRNEFGNFTDEEFYSLHKIEELEKEFIKIQDPFENVDLALMTTYFEAYFAKNLSLKLEGYIELKNDEFQIIWRHKSGLDRQVKVLDFLNELLSSKTPIFVNFLKKLKA